MKLLRLLWWLTLFFSIVVITGSLVGYIRMGMAPVPATGFSFWAKLGNWLAVIFSLSAACLSVGLAVFLFRKKPDDRMALVLSFFLMIYGTLLAGPIEVLTPVLFPQSPDIGLYISGTLFIPVAISLILVFPNGRFDPAWTKWLMPFVLILAVFPFIWLEPAEMIKVNTFNAQVFYVLVVLVFILSIGNQVYRYRHLYTVLEKKQIKWVVYGFFVWIVLLGLNSIPYYYILGLPSGDTAPWWTSLMSSIWFLTLNILPLSFTFAIMRSGLWDIDLIIRKSLVYSLLTLTIGLIYFSSVIVLQYVYTRFWGTESPAIIVISTLIIAAVFNPLRKRIQDGIDRRFYRQKYDTQMTLERFADSIRDDLDLEQLTNQLLSVLVETIQPESVSLWINSHREDKHANQ